MTTTMAASPTVYNPQWHPSPLFKPYWTAAAGHDAFTGYKNELAADEIRPSEMESPPLGSTITSNPAGHNIEAEHSSASGSMPHDQRQDVAGGYYLSPQSTGSESNRLEETEPAHREMPSEMQG